VLPAVGAYLRVSDAHLWTYPRSRQAFAGIMPCWRRFGRVRICITDSIESHKCSQLFSDTYDIYYANQGLIPQVKTDPANENKSEPWTLDEKRGDATVEDICDFIVEYINSDVMVCLRPVLVPTISIFLRFTGPPGGSAHHHCRSINGRNWFVYNLPRPYPWIGRCIRQAVYEARRAL
jgi:hypothetical protein